jgi:hypothetical protein
VTKGVCPAGEWLERSRKANAWVIAGGALALWLGLQVLLHVVGGGWVLKVW